MLKDIKSPQIFKNIFSFVEENKKLILVKHNKYIQNKINISLLNYKLFSVKYIIYDINGNGKIYDSKSNQLISEGKYLNDIKIGKRKKYYKDGKLKF